MPVTLEEVQELVQRKFPESNVDELVQQPNYRVLGTIRWEGFKDLEDRERNRLVTQRVRNELGLKGINLGVLLPLAPGEKL